MSNGRSDKSKIWLQGKVYVVTHVETGPEYSENVLGVRIFGHKKDAEDHFISLATRGLLDEDEFTEAMRAELLVDGVYSDNYNEIKIKEYDVE